MRKANKKNLEIAIVATMSSGKSTFINALLEYEILPSFNKATTAKIVKIIHSHKIEQGQFIIYRETIDHQFSDKIVIDCTKTENIKNVFEQISNWNKDNQTKEIYIQTCIPGIQVNDNIQLTLIDTPGTNNSQDKTHYNITIDYIRYCSNNLLILYILNCTQMGINDDRELLEELISIAEARRGIYEHDFVFLLNKIDILDFEKGESIPSFIKNSEIYLENIGFDKPTIYPISAQYHNLLYKEKLNSTLLTRREKSDLRKMKEWSKFLGSNLNQDIYNNSRDSLNYQDNNIFLEKYSGIYTVKKSINHYINYFKDKL